MLVYIYAFHVAHTLVKMLTESQYCCISSETDHIRNNFDIESSNVLPGNVIQLMV